MGGGLVELEEYYKNIPDIAPGTQTPCLWQLHNMFFPIKKCTKNAYFAHSPVTVHFKVSKNVTAFYSMMFNCNFFSRGGASIELFLLCHIPTIIEKVALLALGVKRPDISVISVLNEAHLVLKMAKCRPILLHELKLPLFL